MSSVSATLLIAGRYRLDRQVATDRFGEVWHGTDVELARPVAVKLLHADASDADTVSQFRAAACRAASLTHEGLVRVFDYCEPGPSDSEQRPFQVMEYVEGQSLAAYLQAGSLGAARTVDIVAQVSAALHAVHRAALAHGDIRPEKILLRRDGAAKLFGFSGTCPAEPAAAIGADLCALGVLARECLGEPTSPGELAASAADLVAELCAHPAAGHADATAAIARRVAALRPQLGTAGGDAALSASQSASSTQPLPRLPRRAGRTPAMRRIVVALGTAAVIAIALAVIAIFGTSRPTGFASGANGAIEATTVRVTAARLIGRPVGIVRLRLQHLGLVVRIRWRESDSVSAGDVIAVRPAGLVPAHGVVVITGSTGRSTAGAAPDVGHARTLHRRHQRRSASPSQRPTPAPSRSPSGSPTASTSSSPTPSSSPTSSPSSATPLAGYAG